MSESPRAPESLPSLLLFFVVAALTSIGVALIASWVIAAGYEASLDGAYTSYVYSHVSNDWLGILSAFKWFGESAAVVALAGALAVMLWRGPHLTRRLWYASIATLALVAAWSFFGQLLPMDQWAWHGTLVRAGIIEKSPQIGPQLRAFIFGDPELGAATLTRFHLLHMAVLPMGILLTSLGIWRGTRPLRHEQGASFLSLGVGTLAAAGVIVLLSTLFPDVWFLEERAQAALAFGDVRPEWYFLSLNQMLALASTPREEMIALSIPGAVAALLIIIPLIRSGGIIRKLLLIGLIGAQLWLSTSALQPDYENGTGYFRTPDIDHVMTSLGKINDGLGEHDHPIDQQRFSHAAADIWMLAQHTRKAGPSAIEHIYPEMDAPNRELRLNAWNVYVRRMEKQARWMWQIPTDDEALWIESRNELRRTCQGCHDAFDESDVDVLLAPHAPLITNQTDNTTTDQSSGEATDELKPSLFPIITEGVQPSPEVAANAESMKKLMKLLRESLVELNNGPNQLSAASIVTSTAATDAFHAYYQTEEGQEEFGIFAEGYDWDASVKRLLDGYETLSQSTDEASYLSTLRVIRRECMSCHDHFMVDEAEAEVPLIRED